MFSKYSQPFIEACKKTHSFYDFSYNNKINMLSSLSKFYSSYSQIECNFTNSLDSLLRQKQFNEIVNCIPQLTPAINQIRGFVINMCYLHEEFGRSLSNLSYLYSGKMKEEKNKKDNFMKLLKDMDVSQQIKDTVTKQKKILKFLYDNLKSLSQGFYEKINEINQQTIQHFNYEIKLYEMQPKIISEHIKRIQFQQIRIDDYWIVQIAELLLNRFNSYNGQKMVNSFCPQNDSLTMSGITKSKYKKFQKKYEQNEITKFLRKYCINPKNFYDPQENYTGVLDPLLFDKQKIRKYLREFNGQTFKRIAYEMFEGFTKAKNSTSEDQNSILMLIKQNLKINSNCQTFNEVNFQSLQKYWSVTKNSVTQEEYIYHLIILQQLSKNNTNQIKLDEIIQKKYKKLLKVDNLIMESKFSFFVKTYFFDILLSSLCMGKSNEPILIHSFIDYLQLIAKFGQQFLQVKKSVTVLLLLRKLNRFMNNNSLKEQIQQIIDSQYFQKNDKNKLKGVIYEQRVKKWGQILVKNITKRLNKFYNENIPLTNYLKILTVMRNMDLNINPLQVFLNCIKNSGYNYIKQNFKDIDSLNSDKLKANDRLKQIVNGLQKVDFQTIMTKIKSEATEISKLASVSQQNLLPILITEFISPTYEFINANLSMLISEKQTDSQGYVRKIGLILPKLQVYSPIPIQLSNVFFKVLYVQLGEAQKNYHEIVRRSRQAEIWDCNDINQSCTSTCLGYFRMMQQPLEFLLNTLKQFEGSNTQFVIRFSSDIKLRSNQMLKNQIIKFAQFLEQSLYPYRNQLQQFCFTAKKIQKSPPIINEQIDKQKKETFKKLMQRLRNLIFFKQSLNQCVSGYIDEEKNQKIEGSIFNLQKLGKLIEQTADNDILTNIKLMAEVLLKCEENIIPKIANITVFTCLKDLFEVLYSPQEKPILDKLLKYQQEQKLNENTTFKKLQSFFSEWFVLIQRNVRNFPVEYKQRFEKLFFRAFYSALERQLLSGQKLKLEIQKKNIRDCICEDVHIIINIMINVLGNNSQVQKQIGKPFSNLLSNLSKETQELKMKYLNFLQVKKDRKQCQKILMILNLRNNDRGAKAFVDQNKEINQ